jgi:hypothetical protein
MAQTTKLGNTNVPEDVAEREKVAREKKAKRDASRRQAELEE